MPDSRPLRVLLVEDDDHDASIIERYLARMKQLAVAGVDRAGSVAEARKRIAEARHDVGLVDLDVEDASGMATIAQLRTVAPHLPAIVLTGANEALAVETMRAGAQDFLSKDELAPMALERAILHAVERHRLTSMVARAERMASVGQLSAGVAHELNSPLAQIRDELTEIEEGLRSRAATEGMLDAVRRAMLRVEHMRSTVEALYSFSSAQQGRRELFDTHRAVRLALRLAENGLRHVAQVQEDIQTVPEVHGDQGRFTQAVLDLLSHSADVARSQRGRLGRVWVQLWSTDRQVVVAVEDDGPTVPAAKRESLLMPFGYSRVGVRGAGLGLAAANEVAREHGGSLEVLDGVHGGIRFELRVPSAGPTRPAPDPEQAAAQAAPSRARVLWIDDDIHLLRAFQRRLRKEHEVEICESAGEALERLDRGERWDVICCDLMMPQLNGRQFESILRERYPDMAKRLIFVTGGVFTEEERRFLEETPQPRLLKPFEWSDLLEAVEEIRRQ